MGSRFAAGEHQQIDVRVRRFEDVETPLHLFVGHVIPVFVIRETDRAIQVAYISYLDDRHRVVLLVLRAYSAVVRASIFRGGLMGLEHQTRRCLPLRSVVPVRVRGDERAEASVLGARFAHIHPTVPFLKRGRDAYMTGRAYAHCHSEIGIRAGLVAGHEQLSHTRSRPVSLV